MIFAPLAMVAAQASDNIPYHYVGRRCSPQGDGHQPVFSGMTLGECEDVGEADRRLNAAYQRALARLNSAQKIELRNAQRRWMISTNKKCDLLRDGSVAFSTEADCFIREATKRTAELTEWGLRISSSVSASQTMPSPTTAANSAKLEGMPYLKARPIILGFGWQPHRGECGGPPVNDTVCSQFPEIDYCSGSGLGYCGMEFTRENRCLIVTTIGGLPGEGSVVRGVKFRRGPCPKT